MIPEVDAIERALQRETRSWWPRIRRFLSAFIPAFVVAVLAARNHLTLGILLSLAFGAAVTALGEIDPAVPWSRIVDALDAGRYGDPVPKTGKP